MKDHRVLTLTEVGPRMMLPAEPRRLLPVPPFPSPFPIDPDDDGDDYE